MSPSLVSPVVSVDVKHHVYLLYVDVKHHVYLLYVDVKHHVYLLYVDVKHHVYLLYVDVKHHVYLLYVDVKHHVYLLYVDVKHHVYLLYVDVKHHVYLLCTLTPPPPPRTAPPVSLATRLHPAALLTAGQITLSFRVPQAGKRDYDKPPKAFGGGNCILLWLEIELSAVILYDVYDGEVKLLETCAGGGGGVGGVR